jgi:hypothetical protein
MTCKGDFAGSFSLTDDRRKNKILRSAACLARLYPILHRQKAVEQARETPVAGVGRLSRIQQRGEIDEFP